MVQYTKYFYIFTKITTSLVLLLIILLMGYSLYSSYKEVDVFANNLDIRYDNLSKLVINNNEKFLILENSVNNNNEALSKLNFNLDKLTKFNIADYENQIINLLESNKRLKSKIENIYSTINNKVIKKQPDTNFQKTSLIDLILLKFKNGESVINELIYLEKLYQNSNGVLFEKLYLIELNKFYGLVSLNKDFENSTKEYVNSKFLENNKNTILNFLFKFVEIRPKDLSRFENEELNILLNAKKKAEQEDIKLALMYVLKIDKEEIFFKKWISQANVFINFTNYIERLI